jgi:DNA replication protein
MQKFMGFPPGSKLSPTAFPAMFFSDLMPMIDDLAELKVTLFCFWALHQKTGRYRYLLHREFRESDALCAGLKAVCSDGDVETALEAALRRALDRGTLLCAEVQLDTGLETLYFVNTELGRTAIEQIKAGKWYLSDNGSHTVEILPERPNIYRLYEANIGALTPRIADHLKDAEKDYPEGWVEDAIYLAVESNKRNWRYIQGILKRWETEGKGGGATGRSDRQDGKSYTTGKYADFIKS